MLVVDMGKYLPKIRKVREITSVVGHELFLLTFPFLKNTQELSEFESNLTSDWLNHLV